MGSATAVLLDADGDLVLIDAGWPGEAGIVLDALAKLGRTPGDLRHLVLTRSHHDHIGSAAALVRATVARTRRARTTPIA